ncbi:InlB B-repeat-containing protein [Butyrivibrio sp. VCD2006]|uniref:InlB B-repeat-containing protein n=1 Tax=Butyrivibrio sp. VCD2006 TaxID=1280664 RepID=UPI0004791451|nr:hypothetical protein [Butyrivibrio sp. VCD2006]
MRKSESIAVLMLLISFLVSSLVINAGAEETKSDAASTIRMMNTEGTVEVVDSAGKELKVSNNMRLFTGNQISTAAKSYVYFNLDDTKAVKLDAVSEAEIRESGKKQEVLLVRGGLLLDVDKPLEATATLNVKTSNMIMGIRGTDVSAEIKSPKEVQITVYKGKVSVVVTNTQTNTTKEFTLEGGQSGIVKVKSQEEASDNDDSVTYESQGITEADIKAYVLAELKRTGKDKEIGEILGMDLESITDDQIAARLATEEEEKEAALLEQQKKEEEQSQQEVRDDHWGEGGETEGGGTTPGTGEQTVNPEGAPATTPTATTPENGQENDEGDTTNEQTSGGNDSSTQNQDNNNDNTNGDGNQNENQNKNDQVTKYKITLNDTTNGKIDSDYKTAEKGDKITITATPNKGYKLGSVTAKTSDDTVSVTTKDNIATFKMPAADVKVSATFKKKSYSITIASVENGSVKAHTSSATMGEKITVTTTPESGYVTDKVTVKDEDGKDVTVKESENGYSFTMPAGNVTVTATFKKISYSVTASSSENGSIETTSTATKGDTVTITTIPDSGYETDKVTVKDVDGNSVSVSGSENSYSFTMPVGNVTVSATFKKKNYSITVSSASGGSASASANTATKGETVTVTTTAESGYEIDKVTVKNEDGSAVSVSGSEDSYSFTMPAGNVTITATFKKISYSVTVASSENGSAESDKTSATKGDTVSITVAPESGYETDKVTVKDVDGNSVSVSGSENSYSFTMPAGNVTVTATFKKANYSVTVSSASNGSAESDKTTANKGDTVSITTTPTSGYETDKVTVKDADGNAVAVSGSEDSYSFTMPASNVTVSAAFKKRSYSITISSADGGSASASADDATKGETVTITTTPDSGYETDKVTVKDADGGTVSVSGSGTSYSFTMPADNVTVTPTFKKINYSVTVSSASNGSAASNKTTANKGDTVSITTTPASGYETDVVTVKDASGSSVTVSGSGDNYGFTMPASNVTVSATFKLKSYTISISSATGGSVVSNKETASKGDTVILTVTANNEYEIGTVSVKDADGGNVSITEEPLTMNADSSGTGSGVDDEQGDTDKKKYSFTMPAKNVTVSATFTQKTYSISVATAVNGSVSTNASSAAKGDTVTITTAPASNYELDVISVTDEDGGSVSVSGSGNSYSFTMPGKRVYVSAAFKAVPIQHNISIFVQNEDGETLSDYGSVSAPSSAEEGTTVSVSFDINANYSFLEATVYSGSEELMVAESESFEFEMGEEDVSIIAKLCPISFYTATLDTTYTSAIAFKSGTGTEQQFAENSDVEFTAPCRIVVPDSDGSSYGFLTDVSVIWKNITTGGGEPIVGSASLTYPSDAEGNVEGDFTMPYDDVEVQPNYQPGFFMYPTTYTPTYNGAQMGVISISRKEPSPSDAPMDKYPNYAVQGETMKLSVELNEQFCEQYDVNTMEYSIDPSDVSIIYTPNNAGSSATIGATYDEDDGIVFDLPSGNISKIRLRLYNGDELESDD